MISRLILCGLMSSLIFFFTVVVKNFSPTSIIYAVFLIFIYSRMTFSERKKMGSSVIYRRIFQTVFAIGFCIAFISDLYAERGSMAITSQAMNNSELPFCHIAIPQVLLPFLITKSIIFPARVSGMYAAVSSMICIWLAVTLTVGRGWCSWICFYGGWEEGFSHAAKKRRLNLIPKNKEMREIHFGFFFFIILASLCQFACVYCEWFCPFKLTTEFFPMNSIPSLIAGVMFIGLFLALVVVLPILTKRRTQCSILCPFGAFASLTDRFSLFRIKIDGEKCIGCLKCANTCPFGAIDILTIQDKKRHPEITCAKCGECINACPQKAIRYEFRFNSKQGKCGCGQRKIPRTKLGQTIQELLEPSELFRFAAFSFAVIMSSGFVDRSLAIIFKAFAKALAGAF